MVNTSELRHRKLGKKNLPPHVKTQVKKEKPSKSCFPLMLFAVITSVAAIMVIGYLISPIKAEVFKDVQHVPLTGVFSVNEKLSKGVRITGLPGPESVVEGSGGKLYTGLADGRIVCIHPSSDGEIGAGKVENITTGSIQGAAMSSDALGHGRPLGLRVIANTLYVMDSIYGLYTVDLITKSTNLLIAPDAVTPVMKFPNDLTFSADGQTVYFTVVSSLDGITDVAHTIFRGDCTSRVFKYDLSTRKLTLVLENLCTANG
uniref:Strictosidine synthase conserved region domain-containing protein n=1 Tax=Ciona savignyi TaxID=51511 RepID=H2Y815_CIOSA